MPTYLLVWNADNWEWETLGCDHEKHKCTGYLDTHWCCGSQRPIQIGSRFFIIRQGCEPRGIFASGMTLSDPYPAPCLNPLTECHESTVPTIDLRLDKLLNPNKEGILSRERLLEISNSRQYWDFPIGGIHMDPAVAGEVEVLWKEFGESGE